MHPDLEALFAAMYEANVEDPREIYTKINEFGARAAAAAKANRISSYELLDRLKPLYFEYRRKRRRKENQQRGAV